LHRAAPVLAFLGLLWSILAAPAAGVAAASAADLPHVPGELIVGFRDPSGPQDDAAVQGRAAGGAIALLRYPAGDDLAAREAAWRARPDVAFAHPNYLGRIGFAPQDTHYDLCWHHANTGQGGGSAGADVESEAAWDVTRGSASVVVAVLDTGVDLDHPELAGRLVAGWDFVNGDAVPDDDNGHGTQVTGILAADAGNGFGVAGVDHFCRVMPLKVVSAGGSGTTFDLIQGLDRARTSGAHVVNMSLIDYPLSAALTAALQAAESAGLILVACAGNGGLGDADVSGPGASPHTISVGATNDQDERTAFSGTGAALELVAPGREVPTVVWNSSDDGHSLFTGCSAAVPIVAGIAALLKAMDPALDQAGARALLRAGAEDGVGLPSEDAPGWDPFHGWGRVSARGALAALAPTGVTAAAAAGALSLEVAPNPLRDRAGVRYGLPRAGEVTVSVYDVSGRLVRTLVRGPRSAGTHTAEWAPEGPGAAPGVYFVRMSAGGGSLTRKVTVLR
jgi:subtilisin family serine protease